jgi:hypothetical protein
MAVVFNAKRRPVGKVAPHRSGAVAAFDGRRRTIGLFVNEDLAVSAILDFAKPPIGADAWLAWVIALVGEESVPSGTETYPIDVDLL